MAKSLTQRQQEATDREDAIRVLRCGFLAPGDRLYLFVTSVTRDHVSRTVKVLVISGGELWNISRHVGATLGLQTTTLGDVRIRGAGLDVGRFLAERLGTILFVEWTCLGDRCQHAIHNTGPSPEARLEGARHWGGQQSLTHAWI